MKVLIFLTAIFFSLNLLAEKTPIKPVKAVGTCQDFAESLAQYLRIRENSQSTVGEKRQIVAKLVKSSADGNESAWMVNFYESDKSGESTLTYIIGTLNFGDKKKESCFLDSVDVIRAG